MMDFVLWYLILGAIVILVRFDTGLIKSTINDWQRQPTLKRLLAICAFLLILLVAALLAWPLFAYVYVRERFERKVDEPNTEPEQTFAVQPQHLLQKLTVQEIEERERVEDPLQAVPEEPFGHLHDAWRNFISMHSEDVEIWSFEGEWRTAFRTELIAGYVKVDAGQPNLHFVTMRKSQEERAPAAT